MTEIINARITSTMLGYEDHNIFTFVLNLDYGGTGQGAGLIALDAPVPREPGTWQSPHRVATAAGMQMIMDVLNTLEVRKWEDLPGKYIRVQTGGFHGPVRAIGHPLKDQWVQLLDRDE